MSARMVPVEVVEPAVHVYAKILCHPALAGAEPEADEEHARWVETMRFYLTAWSVESPDYHPLIAEVVGAMIDGADRA
jgi:hypothetical protein